MPNLKVWKIKNNHSAVGSVVGSLPAMGRKGLACSTITKAAESKGTATLKVAPASRVIKFLSAMKAWH